MQRLVYFGLGFTLAGLFFSVLDGHVGAAMAFCGGVAGFLGSL